MSLVPSPRRLLRRLESRLMSAAILRFGADVDGAWVLEIPGRHSGTLRRTPVKVLHVGGQQYVVALDGGADWARNLQAAPDGAALRQRGRRRAVHAAELPCSQRPHVLRAYLGGATRQRTLDLLGAGRRDPDDAHLRRIAGDHPVFRLTTEETS